MLVISVLALFATQASGQDLFLAHRTPGAPKEIAVPYLDHFHPQRKSTILRVLGRSYNAGKASSTTPTSKTFRPQDFGADPTGTEDSIAEMAF